MDERIVLRPVDECEVLRRALVAAAVSTVREQALRVITYIHLPLGILAVMWILRAAQSAFASNGRSRATGRSLAFRGGRALDIGPSRRARKVSRGTEISGTVIRYLCTVHVVL